MSWVTLLIANTNTEYTLQQTTQDSPSSIQIPVEVCLFPVQGLHQKDVLRLGNKHCSSLCALNPYVSSSFLLFCQKRNIYALVEYLAKLQICLPLYRNYLLPTLGPFSPKDCCCLSLEQWLPVFTEVSSLFCILHWSEYLVSNHSLISKSVKLRLTQLHSQACINDDGLLYSLVSLGFLLNCSNSQ